MNEKDLVKALQTGDAKAQRFLYERYGGPMMGVCLRYLKNEMDAEEVLINGFMKVYQHVDRFEQKGSFEGWVRRIMVNEALQYLRKKEPLHLAIEKDNLHLIEELAAAMGAEIAASRPICDNEWLPMDRQIGSSGKECSISARTPRWAATHWSRHGSPAWSGSW